MVLLLTKAERGDPGPGKERVGRKGGREREKGGGESSSVFQEVKGGSDCFSWNVRKDVFCPLCGDASFPVAVTIRVKCF